jgi:hypothetical protein
MTVLDKVRDRLNTKHPELRYTEARGAITVHAPVPAGFSVWITDGLTVGHDGWHEQFDAEDKALACFAFGFSDQCPLKVTLRGAFAHRWTLESLHDGKWLQDSTTGLLLFPFWRRARVEYRQNGLVKGT